MISIGNDLCRSIANDVFPEEFETFLLSQHRINRAFKKHHAELLLPEFWVNQQKRIEQGFFEESAVCTLKNATDIISKEELLKMLSEYTISCKDVTFRIFGLSLASVNIIISLMIIIILIKVYNTYEKNKL